MNIKYGSLTTLIAGAAFLFSGTALAACQATGFQLQVLGSGGPGASSGRASSAYLLWLEGRSQVLIDAGGGSKHLFHQAGANLSDIDLIALSHFHPDHSAGLPALLWPSGAEFTLAGPDGNDIFPSVESYAERLFGADGVFPILESRVAYNPVQINTDGSTVTDVYNGNRLTVLGMGVPHADVPTVGYRFDYGGVSIAFTSDQNGSNERFIDFIEGVDFLVIHMAGNEDTTGGPAALHAKPSVWGQMATAAGAGHVIVSHIATSDADQLAENLAILADNYTGRVTVSEDLMCIDLRNL